MKTSLHALARVLRLARPSTGWAVATALSLLVVAFVNALPPIFTGRIIDALQRGDAASTFRALGLFAGTTIFAAALGLANTYAATVFRERLGSNLRVALLKKLFGARLTSIERLSFGEVANRLDEDLETLCYRFEYALFPSVESACTFVATVATMLAIDWRFSVAAILAACVSLIPTNLFNQPLARLQRADSDNMDRRSEAISENVTLGALALLRHPVAARQRLERYAGLCAQAVELRLRAAVMRGLASVLTILANLAGPVAILSLGAALLLHHQTSVGTIVMFLMYQSRLNQPFLMFAGLPLQLSTAAIFAARVLEIADFDDESSGEVAFAPGDLQLDRVTVLRGDRAIVNGASLILPVGTHAVLIGPSGAGKSTLGALLLRLLDADDGSIRIGASDVRDFNLSTLREATVVVNQDPLVFDSSLWDNLTVFNPSATPSDVRDAIAFCRLTEVVDRLPDSLQTRLGQRGANLSGGERQRVCVARALLANPAILILDEALTGVDLETEAAIMRDIRTAFAGRTLLVITHRLSAVGDFDTIVNVEDGVIATEAA